MSGNDNKYIQAAQINPHTNAVQLYQHFTWALDNGGKHFEPCLSDEPVGVLQCREDQLQEVCSDEWLKGRTTAHYCLL